MLSRESSRENRLLEEKKVGGRKGNENRRIATAGNATVRQRLLISLFLSQAGRLSLSDDTIKPGAGCVPFDRENYCGCMWNCHGTSSGS